VNEDEGSIGIARQPCCDARIGSEYPPNRSHTRIVQRHTCRRSTRRTPLANAAARTRTDILLPRVRQFEREHLQPRMARLRVNDLASPSAISGRGPVRTPLESSSDTRPVGFYASGTSGRLGCLYDTCASSNVGNGWPQAGRNAVGGARGTLSSGFIGAFLSQVDRGTSA